MGVGDAYDRHSIYQEKRVQDMRAKEKIFDQDC